MDLTWIDLLRTRYPSMNMSIKPLGCTTINREKKQQQQKKNIIIMNHKANRKGMLTLRYGEFPVLTAAVFPFSLLFSVYEYLCLRVFNSTVLLNAHCGGIVVLLRVKG